MRGEKKNEVDKIIVVPWEKSYSREKKSNTKDELPMDDIKTTFLILQEYEEGITIEQIARQQGHLDVIRFIERYKKEGPRG